MPVKKKIPKTSRRTSKTTKRSPVKRTQTKRSPVRRTPIKRSPVKRTPIKRSPGKSKTIRKGSRPTKERISYQYPVGFVPPQIPEKYQEINTFVSGLKHFIVLYSQKYDKIVYLLGEYHMYEGCSTSSQPLITADKFFFNLMDTTQKFLDVFLEVGLSPEEKSAYKFDISSSKVSNLKRKGIGYLEKTLSKLSKKNCGVNIYKENQNFQKCSYKNSRIHSVDIRRSKHSFSNYLANLITFLLYCIKFPIRPKQTCTTEQKFLNNQTDFLHDELIIKHLNDYFTKVKIERQITNIKYPEVRQFVMNKYQQLIDNVSLINYNYIRSVIRVQDETKKDYLINEIVDYISNFMDIYAFPRLFRSFRKLEGVYSEDPKNIIIYGGGFHTGEYNDWLKELGFETIYSTYNKNGEDNCIEIKNFTPIFLS